MVVVVVVAAAVVSFFFGYLVNSQIMSGTYFPTMSLVGSMSTCIPFIDGRIPAPVGMWEAL